MIEHQERLGTASSFSELLQPYDEATFFAEYWEQQPLYIQKASAHAFGELLTLDAMDRLLSDVAFRADECKIAREGQIIPVSSYLAAPGMRVMGRAAADYVDAAAALNWFDQGATLVFAQLNQKWPPLQQLKKELERSLSATVIANVFLSNRNAQGFSVHYDSHDVFVVQLHGKKAWSLYDSPIELPTKSEAFGTTGVSPGPLASTVTLNAGDVLYVPRGYFHEARTTDSVSLHVTFGVHPYLWVDFIGEMISSLGCEWAGLRRSVPRSFMEASEDERVALIREKLCAMTDRNSFGRLASDVYSSAIRHRLQSGPRPLRHHLAAIIASQDLTQQSQLYRRDAATPVDAVCQDGKIVVRCHGQAAVFPDTYAPMVEAVCAREAFRVADLPSPGSPDQKLSFARRLVGVGLLGTRPEAPLPAPAQAA